mgnify:FL=1
MSLTEPNTTCKLPGFHHPENVKYLGYVEKMNAIIACLEDIPDCYTFDGLSWKALPLQRKPSCASEVYQYGDAFDSFQAIPQGLVNVKVPKPGKEEEESWQCQANAIVSEIYNGQVWVYLDIEDANITKLPIKFVGITPWRISFQQSFFVVRDVENNRFWWSLNYKSRKWVRSTPPMDNEGVDYSEFPRHVLYRGEGEGHLGFYTNKEQVYQTKEMRSPWTPLDGVFLPYTRTPSFDPFLVGLVPKSFSVGCLDDY